MQDDQIITFETYYDPMLAHIIRTRLEDNDIACFIADENMNVINPLYNNALGGIKLKIFAHDMERCRAILAEDPNLPSHGYIEIVPETETVVTCPVCNSTNVRFGAATKDKFGWLSFTVAIVLFIYPLSAKKAWHCFNCGEDYPKTP